MGQSDPCSPVDWLSSERLQFAIHGAHPTGSVPHQKIAVIDDALALCGGIDFTGDRWDTREHKHRSCFRRVLGRSYGPRHEIAAAVDGAATRAVGELARDRWRTATGQSLAPIDPAHVVWPRGLEPILHDIDVVIDDRLLRVGSSNLNDRSMGFDRECDLAIEADANTPEHEGVCRKITSARDELVSEHLGVSVGEFERVMLRQGGFLKAIEALHGQAKTLRPFTRRTVAGEESPLAENDLMDPDHVPRSLTRSVQRWIEGLME